MKRRGVWGGRTHEERRADRRDRMIAAAIKIWSEQGWAAVTMRRVCALTSLNDRYFYDEFTDRDGLLVATWLNIQDTVLAPVAATYAQWGPYKSWEELTRLVTTVFVDRIVAEPAKTKILLSRSEGNPVLDVQRQKSLERAVGLVMAAARPRLKPGFDEQTLQMDAVVSVGGFVELLRAWQSGFVAVDCERIVEHTCKFAVRFGASYLTARCEAQTPDGHAS